MKFYLQIVIMHPTSLQFKAYLGTLFSQLGTLFPSSRSVRRGKNKKASQVTNKLDMQITPEKIRSLTRPIFQKHNSIDLAYLFGSVANQTSGKLSDIDIGMYVNEKFPTKDILNLQLDLIGELTSALNVNSIDLAVMNLASNTLNFEIIKCNYPLFVKNEDTRIDVEQRIHSTYLDRRYHESLYNQIFLQQVGARKHND